MKCLVSCGHCCEYWRDVIIGNPIWESKACQYRKIPLLELRLKLECPFIEVDGCGLPRKSRPLGCIYYHCSLSLAYGVLGLISEEEAKGRVRRCEHESPSIVRMVKRDKRRMSGDRLAKGEKKIKVKPVDWSKELLPD